MTTRMSVLCMAACLVGGESAAAADTPVGLERFYSQRPEWIACGDEQLDAAGAQCAEVSVPLNYAQPQGRTITIAISRLRAADPAKRRGVMLSNPGGPGGPGLDFPLEFGPALSQDVRDRYDLIGMDPRGIGRSAPVNCGWPIGQGYQSAGVDAVSYAKSVATQADLAARCLVRERDELLYITTRNTARDMDVIRGALGEETIGYYGISYGTYLGWVFTQMFPDRADRIVLDSAIDPQRWVLGHIQDWGAPNEAALDDWADWTAAHDDEYRLGTTRSEVRDTVTALIQQAAAIRIRIGAYELDDHWVPILLFDVLRDQRRNDVLARLVGQLRDAAAGVPVQPTAEQEKYLAVMLRGQPHDTSATVVIWCGDVGAPRDPGWYWRNIEDSRAARPVFGPLADNITPCAFWPDPIEAPTVVVQNSVPALILQATGDTRTAYQEGVALHQLMTGSRLATLRDVRIHTILATFPNRCVTDAVDTYFRDGALPDTDIICTSD
ncbi:alpha/beta fold hydrolase [Nocardia sp. NPDC051570]|uniref:alpha/beta fold hydrolase n=1 Tax=Nocardia sp. NPDC051570 TaxID=3364324 RepID=UPI0037A70501